MQKQTTLYNLPSISISVHTKIYTEKGECLQNISRSNNPPVVFQLLINTS